MVGKVDPVLHLTWLARLGSSLSSLLRSSMIDFPSRPESAKISWSASLAGLDSGACGRGQLIMCGFEDFEFHLRLDLDILLTHHGIDHVLIWFLKANNV